MVVTGEFVNAAELSADELGACTYRHESGFYFSFNDAEQPAPTMSKHRKHPPKEDASVTTTAPAVEVVADAAPVSLPPSPIPVAIPDAIAPAISSIGAAPADLRNVLPAASETSGLTVIMAVVAVAGGGAAWKFYNDHSKRKHEQEMARIERGSNDDSHKKCDASRAALELRVTDVHAKVEAIYARLDAIQQGLAEIKNTPPKLPFDADDLEERLAKLEKLNKKGRK